MTLRYANYQPLYTCPARCPARCGARCAARRPCAARAWRIRMPSGTAYSGSDIFKQTATVVGYTGRAAGQSVFLSVARRGTVCLAALPELNTALE